MLSFFLEYSPEHQQVHVRTFPVSLFLGIKRKKNQSGGSYMVQNLDNRFKFSKMLSVRKTCIGGDWTVEQSVPKSVDEGVLQIAGGTVNIHLIPESIRKAPCPSFRC